MPTVIYNPITVEFSAMFTFKVYIILRGKHCRHPIAIMEVEDYLGQWDNFDKVKSSECCVRNFIALSGADENW